MGLQDLMAFNCSLEVNKIKQKQTNKKSPDKKWLKISFIQTK